jgi:hypothetical protein
MITRFQRTLASILLLSHTLTSCSRNPFCGENSGPTPLKSPTKHQTSHGSNREREVQTERGQNNQPHTLAGVPTLLPDNIHETNPPQEFIITQGSNNIYLPSDPFMPRYTSETLLDIGNNLGADTLQQLLTTQAFNKTNIVYTVVESDTSVSGPTSLDDPLQTSAGEEKYLTPSMGKPSVYQPIPSSAQAASPREHLTTRAETSPQHPSSQPIKPKRLAPSSIFDDKSSSATSTRIPYATTSPKEPITRPIRPRGNPSITVQHRLVAQQQQARTLRVDNETDSIITTPPTKPTLPQEQPTQKRQYQLARVQNLSPTLSSSTAPRPETVTITTREGHQVTFIPTGDYWRAIVQENCPPGFARTLDVPILYPQGTYRPTVDPRHTVEYLQRAMQTLQQQWVHVVLPSQNNQPAYVYTGPLMGLLGGGGFWKTLGIALVTITVCTLVATGVGAIAGASIAAICGTSLSGAAMTGMIIGGMCGFFYGCVSFLSWRNHIQESEDDIDGFTDFFKNEGSKTLQEIDDIIKERVNVNGDKNILAYKKESRKGIIELIDEEKKCIKDKLDEVEDWRRDLSCEKDFFQSVREAIPYLIKHLLSKNPMPPVASREYIKKCEAAIQEAREILDKIDKKKKEAIGKFRNQALKDLDKEREEEEKKTGSLNEKLCGSIKQITANGELPTTETKLNKLRVQVEANKAMYEKWKIEWESDPPLDNPSLKDDLSMLDNYIEAEEARLKELDHTSNLIAYAQEKGNMEVIKQLSAVVEKVKKKKELTSEFLAFIQENSTAPLYYAIVYLELPIKAVDRYGNTCLHFAAENNKKDMVEMLLNHGARACIRTENNDRELPSDLTNDPEIEELLKPV